MDPKALLYHAIFLASVLWPAYVICRRAGVKPVWVLTLCVPLFGLVLFSCALAFQKWQSVEKAAA